MSGSAVPAALADLAELARSVAPAGVSVSDGPPVRTGALDVVCIGYSGALDQPGVGAVQAVSTYGLANSSESCDISNLVSCTRAVNDIPAVRARAFDIFDRIAAALVVDRTLGQTVGLATITNWDYVPAFVEKGTAVDITFTVHLEAWRKT